MERMMKSPKVQMGLKVVAILAIIGLVAYLGMKTVEKFTGIDPLEIIYAEVGQKKEEETVKAADSMVEQEAFLAQKTQQLTSQDLLPPAEAGDELSLADKNFLISDFQPGIDSRGTSLRNPNLQLRSDPVIPLNAGISPFNQPVIDSQDPYRKHLEIGE